MLDEQRNNQEFSSIYNYKNFNIFLFDLVVPAKLQATSHAQDYREGMFNLDKHIVKHKFHI